MCFRFFRQSWTENRQVQVKAQVDDNWEAGFSPVPRCQSMYRKIQFWDVSLAGVFSFERPFGFCGHFETKRHQFWFWTLATSNVWATWAVFQAETPPKITTANGSNNYNQQQRTAANDANPTRFFCFYLFWLSQSDEFNGYWKEKREHIITSSSKFYLGGIPD